jgi:tRNA pseudouridine65 synthase
MGLLTVIYQDDDIVAIDKPEGVLVHRSRISRDHVFVMQLLRDQIGQFVYPIHRLDRPTSGVLLFALSSEMAAVLNKAFSERRVQKRYLAIVRGRPDAAGTIETPIRDQDAVDENGQVGNVMREARTDYRLLHDTELKQQIGPHPTTRYAMVEARPYTGRMHQIRVHLKSIYHPIIGDTKYGEGRHNRYFRDTYAIRRLLLHAIQLDFPHPRDGRAMSIKAPLPAPFLQLMLEFGWH